MPALEAYLASSSSSSTATSSTSPSAPAPAPAATPADKPPPSHGPYALGLRQMGALLARLPREVLDDVLPRSAGLLKRVRRLLSLSSLSLSLFGQSAHALTPRTARPHARRPSTTRSRPTCAARRSSPS